MYPESAKHGLRRARASNLYLFFTDSEVGLLLSFTILVACRVPIVAPSTAQAAT